MGFALIGLSVSLVLFLALLLLQEVGRRIGRAQLARDPAGARMGVGPIESSVLALLGLLVAFTFNGAANRFEARRGLIAQEANAIGTAYLRLDLLAEAQRASLRRKFRLYLAERLAAYRALPDFEAARASLARSQALQDDIWGEAVPATAAAGGAAPMLLLGALNAMIDVTTTRLVATQAHPPTALYGMLGALTLVSGVTAGYAMAARRSRPTLHMIAYAAMLAASLYVIMDLEYPRLGLIRIDEADRTLVELLERMGGAP